LKVNQIGVFQKFKKTKQKKAKPSKIVQDQIKTNVFVSYCEEEKKRKKTKLRFVLEQSEEKRI
jgi:hypothetical protein